MKWGSHLSKRKLKKPSIRAQVITRRTYNRELDDQPGVFETWEQTRDRVIEHQRWLWERAKGKKLSNEERKELDDLGRLILFRDVLPAGRTLWLGGTSISRNREASMFNCSYLRAETVHDVVDAFWLLLQGCGVGFTPVVGTLSGYSRPIKLEVIPSTRLDRGYPDNVETFDDQGNWTIVVGDSAEAWAKLVGKVLANKRMSKKLVLDFREIRPAGTRLKGYGWISSGHEPLAKAITAIHNILNSKIDRVLDAIDILDILNWLGTTLSSRRSAEIALMNSYDRSAKRFVTAKKDHFAENPQRAQSNNSLMFHAKPSRADLEAHFALMVDNGGSEPGIVNASSALKRAPWFKGFNPCAEILLGNKSFCNLVEVNLRNFNNRPLALDEAVRLVARANYRQTCVDLDDGVLQAAWDEQNSFLHLCGVGMTGIVTWQHQNSEKHLKALRARAILSANMMADELKMPRPKLVTTVKPSGTVSKIADTTEGIHKPLGKYIFNNVRFSIHDPILDKLRGANYRIFPDPYASDAVLVTLPVAWDEVEFEQVEINGEVVDVNLEPAVAQLDRYLFWMRNYVQHNASITVSYDPSEIPAIIDWLDRNWDEFVAVSFLPRNDPTKTAEDLGYPYLPQEVVSKATYDAYTSGLRAFRLDFDQVEFEEIIEDDCQTGACPIR